MISRHIACATLAALLAIAWLNGGCGRAGAPASEEENKDYRALIQRTRDRQESTGRYQALERSIRDFHVQLGRFPTNLNELVRAGFIETIPPPPPGTGYSFDPVSGAFRLVRMSPDSGGQAGAAPRQQRQGP